MCSHMGMFINTDHKMLRGHANRDRVEEWSAAEHKNRQVKIGGPISAVVMLDAGYRTLPLVH